MLLEALKEYYSKCKISKIDDEKYVEK